MASGTLCAMSMAPMSLHWVIFMVVPNSDAYLAQKYPSEFPAYLAKTPRLIPGVKSGTAMAVIGLLGTVVGMVGMFHCGDACGMSNGMAMMLMMGR